MFDERIDIINYFPTAKQVKSNPEVYSLYLLEEELKSLFRLIVWAANQFHDTPTPTVSISSISKGAKEFLKEKGYRIEKNGREFLIYL